MGYEFWLFGRRNAVWKDFLRFAVRIVLCLLPFPLAFLVTWRVSVLNNQIYNMSFVQPGHFSHPVEDTLEPFAGLFLCWLTPQLVFIILATRFAVDRRSLVGYYLIIALNTILAILFHFFLSVPYDYSDDTAIEYATKIDHNVNIGALIILAICVLAGFLVPRIPKVETNPSEPNHVT